MAMQGYLDYPILGWSTDIPAQAHITVKGQAGKTFRARVIDAALNTVYSYTDITNISDPFSIDLLAGAELNTIYSNYGEGVYILICEVVDPTTGEVLEQLSLKFMIATNRTSLIITKGKTHVIVVDNITGAGHIFGVETTVYAPYGNRWSTIVHDEYQGKGKIIIVLPDGSTVETGYGKYAIVELTYSFSDLQAMLNWLYRHAYNFASNKAAILTVYDSAMTDEEKAKILAPFAIQSLLWFMQGKVLDAQVTIDTTNNIYEIKATVRFRLGFLDIDWKRVLTYAATGAAIAGAAAIAVATAGIALPVSISAITAVGGLTGAAVALWTDRGSEQSPTLPEKQTVSQKAEQGRQNVSNMIDQTKNFVVQKRDEGAIDATTADQLLTMLDEIKAAVLATINEVEAEAYKAIDKAYDDGYKDGKYSMYKWTAAAGIGGTALGVFLTRRVG